MTKALRLTISCIAVAASTGLISSNTAAVQVTNTDPASISWSKAQASEANIWEDVAFGNGAYVAVSGNGDKRVMVSSDPTCTPASPATSCWTSVDLRTIPNWTTVNWRSVTFGEGLFVAVGEGASASAQLAMTSPDGTNWTPRTTNPNEQRHWREVEYANGNFVAVAFRNSNSKNVDVMTSPDGITWTLRTTPEFTNCTSSNSASCNQFTALTYGNGVWVAVAADDQNGPNNNVMRSVDNGATWTYVSVPSAQEWRDVSYSGTHFIAVNRGPGVTMMSSPDGLTWTALSAPAADAVVAFGSTVVIVNGNSLGIAYSYAADAFCTPIAPATHCFTTPSFGSAVDHKWQTLEFLNGRFFMVGTQSSERVAYTSVFTPPQVSTPAPDPEPSSESGTQTPSDAGASSTPANTTQRTTTGKKNQSGTGIETLPETGAGIVPLLVAGTTLLVFGLGISTRRRSC